MKRTVLIAVFLLPLLTTFNLLQAQTTIDLSQVTSNDPITLQNGDILTGTLDVGTEDAPVHPVKIMIADGATVTLQDVTVNGIHKYEVVGQGWQVVKYYEWAGITCLGNATINLVGTNTVKGFWNQYPGIYVPEDKTLTLQGTGSLTASSNGWAAGIGGGNYTYDNLLLPCGNIVINSGTITAIGGHASAAIGGYAGASCGNITINGGIVIADFDPTAGSPTSEGAGIGSGLNGGCGSITITGGTVTAYGQARAAGIGSGASISGNTAGCGPITITGGRVTAIGGARAAGIGGGVCSSSELAGTSYCGTITITDGVTRVKAVKGYGAPNSIGPGLKEDDNVNLITGDITIGGVVYWDGTNYRNGGDDPETGIVKSIYKYPVPAMRVLDDIPVDWTVTTEDETVTVTPYYTGSPLGSALIPEDDEVVLTPSTTDNPRVKSLELEKAEEIPLTFEAMVAGATVRFSMCSEVVTDGVEYSTDGSTWSTYTSYAQITLAHVGDKVSFRGQNAAYGFNNVKFSHFSCNGNCYVYGNVMSLIDSSNFATNNTLTAVYALSCLFLSNEKIYSHASKALVLPATTLTSYCYRSMFQDCTHLTSAPILPATVMDEGCYYSMFSGCTGLTTAPELPSTTLANECYKSMFRNCTSLTTAPELPATTLVDNCYYQMFDGCSNLTTAPILPAPTLTARCYNKMFNGCSLLNSVTCLATSITANECTDAWLFGVAATGTFYKPAGMNSWTLNSSNGIPTGWTAQDAIYGTPLTFEAKVAGATVTFTKAWQLTWLPVEYSTDGTTWYPYTEPITLDNVGDKVSFRGNNAAYATDTLDDDYYHYYSYFSCTGGCYVYGNIMSLVDKENFATNTTLTSDYTFCRLFYNTANIYNHATNALLLPATTLTDACYYGMFQGCSSLTTAPTLPATTLAAGCYSAMFKGCTNLATAPELPATTLADSCYYKMFQGCNQLTTAPVLPATTLAAGCYSGMFKECTSLTTAPELPATTLANNCYYEMFNGCSLLNSVTCFATDISATDCTTDWLANVAATGTFIKPEYMNDWAINDPSGIPTGWTATAYETFLPLTFEAKTAGSTVAFTINATAAPNGVEYSTDGTIWNPYTSNTFITLDNVGDKVSFRGNNSTYATDYYNYSQFFCTGDCYFYGNIMSLVDKDNFATNTTLTSNYTFSQLFYNSDPNDTYYHFYSHSTKALVLPATTLTVGCYDEMFYRCFRLTAAPALPATTLTEGCYHKMFGNCTGLSSAPELPATTLAPDCYSYMFAACTNLTAAPELPATTLTDRCYYGMFQSCTGLTTAPALPATTLANNCYLYMFYGCTGLTTAPELPATTLAEHCYDRMFYGCSQLNKVTCLATDISATNCTREWLYGVAASGTFIKPELMTDWTLDSPNGIPQGWTVKPSETFLPLTFEAKTAGATVTFTAATSINNLTIEYSLNGGAWTTYESAITLANVGDKVSFRGNNNRYGDYYTEGSYSHFSCSDDCYLYGNIMSLIDKDNFTTITTLPNPYYTFVYLFYNNAKIYSHATKALLLPATTLAPYCYYGMFRGCTSLTTAPALPATTLADYCYGYMFNGCTSLTTAPALPATMLTNFCYYKMFEGCSLLNSVTCFATDISATNCTMNWLNGVAATGTFIKPELMNDWAINDPSGIPTGWTATAYETFLPLTFEAKTAGATVTFTKATSLSSLSIEYSLNGGAWTTYTGSITLESVGDKVSFRGNNSRYATSIFASDKSKFSCTRDCYVYGNIMSLVSSTDYADANTLTSDFAFTGLFYNNTHIVNHPSKTLMLPATTLAAHCYYQMFYGCTRLTTAPALPATTLASNCYYYMFNGCTSLTTAPELPATTLASNCYNNMFNGCTSLTTAPELPATTLAASCYSDMFSHCTSLTTAPELPATTLADLCYYSMFNRCSSLTTAPALPATTLATKCYYWMFSYCTNLATAPVLPAKTLTEECYREMFKYCSQLSSVTCLATDITATNCTREWLYGVAATGTFIKPSSMNDWTLDSPNGIPQGWTPVVYETLLPLTFEAKTAGATVTFTAATSISSLSVEYSTDGTTWNTYTEPVTLASVGDKVSFRGNNAKYATNTANGNYSHFSCSDDCYLYGNIMSLVDSTNFATNTTLPSTGYTFVYLFYNNDKIYNHATKALVLPATTLSSNCYSQMFYGCTHLTTSPALPATNLSSSCYYRMFYGCSALTASPELPATTLSNYCYSYMFSGCTSLTTAPELPATTLVVNCYDHMFDGCTSLTPAPELPATTLANNCYNRMFSECTSLTTAPELPATTLASNCYGYMFYGCTSLTTAPELPATTLTNNCYYNMFYGCTSLTTAPELPATTLANSCYQNMFSGCTSLTTAPELPATTLANYCYSSMFQGCNHLTTAPVLPATTLTNYCYQRMFQGCTQLSSVTCLATDISATGCTDNWLRNVANNGTFNKAASMSSWTTGSSGIPTNWLVINEGVLPGEFTVNAGGGKVHFSMGNLQYQANSTDATEAPYTGVWRFAGHQYDNIGASNANIAENYTGWIDLFGWGTSGYAHRTNDYQPWSSSTTNANYTAYNSLTENLYDEDGTADWGYNAICNGGNTENSGWRTPKNDEWGYVFNSRETTSGIRYAKATVNGVTGVILLPDDWDASYCALYNTNTANATWSSNVITLSKWCSYLEAHGAVFFPTSGNRDGANNPSSGFVNIWSSDYDDQNNAHVVFIPEASCNPNDHATRSAGLIVRLVKNIVGAGSLSYSETSVNKMSTEPAFTNELTKVGDGTVSYTRSAGDDICTVNATTGEVTLNGTTGTCTITATVANSSFFSYAMTSASYTLTVEVDPRTIPLTFEAKTNGVNVKFTEASAITLNSLDYNLYDGNGWQTYTSGTVIPLANAGDKVSFRGNNAKYAKNAQSSSGNYSYFSCWSNDCYVYGNVMSLIDSINFATKKDLTGSYTFFRLFNNSSTLCNHPNKELLLPAETLTTGCYYEMFNNCSKLTTAPKLPATAVTNYCYCRMFYNCQRLETAPALPAMTLAQHCYSYMFANCSTLTEAPELPATTLAQYCYSDMFANCTTLTVVPELPATTLDMDCYSQMFLNCTNITSAPVLPAPILTSYCYSSMFSGCTQLNSVTCLATDISASHCTYHWLDGVASTGTFNRAALMNDWPTGPYTNNVNGIPEGWTVRDDSFLPLTFEAKAAGAEVSFIKNTPYDSNPLLEIEYSINDGTWTTYDGAITLTNVGDKVSFRGNNASYEVNKFSCSDDCYIYGNVMSLVDPTNFTTATTLTETWAFKLLFGGNDKIYNHSSKLLVLPATSLTEGCYYGMFKDCTSLTTAPTLPAVALSNSCYKNMFEGCTSLKAAPQLPATSLAEVCYYEMFKGCTGLLTAPSSLPATTLQQYCYMGMFRDCTSLMAAPTLPATTMQRSCYQSMFDGCTSLTTAPALPATTLGHQCYANMFYGCTSLTTAPGLLPAMTLQGFCYNSMFYNCTSLTIAPELPATTLALGCYQTMFSGCTSLTTAHTLPATILVQQCYQSMFKNCTNLTSVTCLATNITATDCTKGWLNGVAATGTFNKAASMTSWPIGPYTDNVNGIPEGWMVINEGLLPGGFTVNSSGGKVNFSMGNLQATGTTQSSPTSGWMWAFAGNQYNYVDYAVANTAINGNGTISSGGKVDLFGWSTSATYFGINNNNSNSTYSGDFVDWGSNAISNGGNVANIWRTLSKDEWIYLFNTRTTTSGVRYAKAEINNITGVILLPDDWSTSYYALVLPNSPDDLYSSNRMSLSVWKNSLEAHGAVFLPCGSFRAANVVSSWYGNSSDYWTATDHGTTEAGTVYIYGSTGDQLTPDSYCPRYYGNYVRLVKNVAGEGSLGYADPAVNKTTDDEAFTNPLTKVGDGAVTYARSSGDDICTVNATTGVVTLNGSAGTCTITATVANSTFFTYATNTASYTLTVTEATPQQTPLTFEAKTAGATVTFTKATTLSSLNDLEYNRYDGEGWKAYSLSTPPTITLSSIGDKVSFRGNNAKYATGTGTNQYSCFSCSNDCYVYGNVMSLIDSVNYPTLTELTNDYAFCGLFSSSNSSNSKIYNHPTKTLVLPATTLSQYCYAYMFNNCGNLTTAPALPATTLARSCYSNMFSSCKALATAPTLPATTLAESCYSYMFFFSTGLTTAPALPATTLAESCYSQMFHGCTSLTTAPALPATTLANRCYNYMFQGCTTLTTVPALPATVLADDCYKGMFRSCTNITTVPETLLPATTLSDGCYQEMFHSCSGLTTAPTLPATTLAEFCYYSMFSSCSSLTTAPALPATTLADDCYRYMFMFCTSLTTAPVLPATTLANSCYDNMFKNCTNLNSVTCLATDISATDCTKEWLKGVAATGTFNKAASMTSWPTGPYTDNVNGIPSGWTTIPVVPGAFSVSSTKQVYFSQGNLRATDSNEGWSWSFAEHQYECLGNAGSNISFHGTVDLFGWNGETSGADNYGISISATDSEYGNTAGESLKHDWGHNPITNGGNTADLWRTLTKAEWEYLFNTRSTPSGVRFAAATVNGVNGMILLPDDWNTTYYSLSSTNTVVENITNTVSLSEWNTSLEAHGAVFLPATTYLRSGNDYWVQPPYIAEVYWTNTSHETEATKAYIMFIMHSLGDSPSPQSFQRHFGCHVRLVRDAN